MQRRLSKCWKIERILIGFMPPEKDLWWVNKLQVITGGSLRCHKMCIKNYSLWYRHWKVEMVSKSNWINPLKKVQCDLTDTTLWIQTVTQKCLGCCFPKPDRHIRESGFYWFLYLMFCSLKLIPPTGLCKKENARLEKDLCSSLKQLLL